MSESTEEDQEVMKGLILGERIYLSCTCGFGDFFNIDSMVRCLKCGSFISGKTARDMVEKKRSLYEYKDL